MRNTFIKALSKLAPVRKVERESERRTGVYKPAHENSSTESTHKFSTGVEFRKSFIGFFILCLSILFSPANANTPTFLKPDEAFVLTTQVNDPTHFTLHWEIAPGYHLYSDAIQLQVISPHDATIAPLHLPESGVPTFEPSRGHFLAYYKQLSIPVTLTAGNTKQLTLNVEYQGCADIGLCFPPQKETITLNTGFHFSDLLNDSDQTTDIDRILHTENPLFVLFSFFVFGILLTFTPCVFPMLPILSSIIASHGNNITSRHAFWLSLIYVLASALTYALLGVFAGLAGHHLQSALQNAWVLFFSGLLFVLLALSLFGMYELRLPTTLQTKLTQLSHQQMGHSLWGVALMGIFSTLIISPCVSAPLVGALGYIGQTGSALFGGIALFVMGIGMGLPLLVIGASAGKLLPKAGQWMSSVKNFFGIVLVGMAIWIWSRLLPTQITLALWGILAITSAVCLGALEAAPSGWPRFWKAIGLLVGIYGICLFLGAMTGASSFITPLEKLVTNNVETEHKSLSANAPLFKRIASLDDLTQAIKHHNPIMVDFYADWCIACKQMEKTIFNDPEVQATLAQYHIEWLQVDLTESNAENVAIVHKYHVVAPPTIIFFDKQGQWVLQNNIVGEQTKKEFLTHIQEMFA